MDLMPFHGPPATAPEVPGFTARTLLGFGTHGEVWLADDLSTGAAVALKIGRRGPSGPATGDPPDRPPDRETALLCRIDHPHVVRLQRVVPLPDGGLAMVLDLASGGSLASLVAARGRFGPGEVSTLLVPLAGALEHLHGRGVVHGDISPGNVLFAGDGRPLLGDLGVARILGTRGEVWATPGFTDPALSGSERAQLDPRTVDLWGLAAVGWFALTGRPPDPARAGLATVDRAPALSELLSQCLSRDPTERPSLTDLADRAWEAAHPTPVRLVPRRDPLDGEAGLPPVSVRVTRRVPEPLAGSPAANGDGWRPGLEDDGAWVGDSPGAMPAALAIGPLTPPVRSGPAPGTDHRLGLREPGDRDRGRAAIVRRWPGRPAGRPGERPGFGRRRDPARETGSGRPIGTGGVAVSGRGIGTGGDRGGRDGRRRRASRSVLIAVTVLVIGSAAAMSVATAIRSGTAPGDREAVRIGDPDRPAAAPSASGSGSSDTKGDTTGGTTPAFSTEMAQALAAVGRSRAAAFQQVSARYLAGADVSGSPAYQDDLQLVQRLKARGYRLEGVRYQVSGVRVWRRRGELVDVRAVVTTSEHRQVRISSGTAVSVPADGPRPVLLTLAPVDANLPGAARWRVRNVEGTS